MRHSLLLAALLAALLTPDQLLQVRALTSGMTPRTSGGHGKSLASFQDAEEQARKDLRCNPGYRVAPDSVRCNDFQISSSLSLTLYAYCWGDCLPSSSDRPSR